MLCEGCYDVRERGGSTAPVMSWGGVRRWGEQAADAGFLDWRARWWWYSEWDV